MGDDNQYNTTKALRTAPAGGFTALVELLITNKRQVQGWKGTADANDSGSAGSGTADDAANKFKDYLNGRDNEGCPPLYLAALNGHVDVVEYLLSYKELIKHDDKNAKGWSALRAALSGDHGEVSELLLGIDNIKVKKEDNDGWSALCQASGGGHFRAVSLLLNKHQVDVGEEDTDGFRPLYLAANAGHDMVVRLLIQKNAGVDAKSRGGLTALFAASNTGNAQVVERLLIAVAKPEESVTSEGDTPLDVAVAGGHAAVVKLLLDKLQA